MEPDVLLATLVALALPVWLVVEQVLHWKWFSKQSEGTSSKPASAAAAARTRRHAMKASSSAQDRAGLLEKSAGVIR
jgi:hypothetical protein